MEYLGDDLLNRELGVDAGADFDVAGWNSGFSDERGITPEVLDELGIQSFMHAESCYNYPQAPEQHEPFEGLYTDLERLGQIFGVEDRAEELVDEYRTRVAEVRENAPGGDPVPVFLYDSGTDQAFTAAGQVPPTDIIRFAGGENVFGDVEDRWTQVGWEPVVEAEPEVIIVLDYGDQSAEGKIDFLTSSPATADLPAVQEENFFVLDYNEGISAPATSTAWSPFAEYLREHEEGTDPRTVPGLPAPATARYRARARSEPAPTGAHRAQPSSPRHRAPSDPGVRTWRSTCTVPPHTRPGSASSSGPFTWTGFISDNGRASPCRAKTDSV